MRPETSEKNFGAEFAQETMLNAGVLTFREFAMREPLPLAPIHDGVLEFLRGRDDLVVFGSRS